MENNFDECIIKRERHIVEYEIAIRTVELIILKQLGINPYLLKSCDFKYDWSSGNLHGIHLVIEEKESECKKDDEVKQL